MDACYDKNVLYAHRCSKNALTKVETFPLLLILLLETFSLLVLENTILAPSYYNFALVTAKRV